MTISNGRLAGKTAIVTGGGAGIGQGIANLFAREGAKVIVADRDAKTGASTVAEIVGHGGVARFHHTDVSKEQEIQRLITDSAAAYGGLDILVNNAGYGNAKTAEDAPPQEWDDMFSVNAKGMFLATKFVIPHLRARGGGSIINIGSLFAVRASPSYAVYHATKGAVRSFTKSTALAHAREGIRVNVVHPGVIRTPGAMANPASQSVAAANLGPMGRWGEPDDIAYGCLYLASDEAKFVTGIDLCIDGGAST